MQGTYNMDELDLSKIFYKMLKTNRAPMTERNEQIYAERMSGKTLQSVGDKFGVSRERVRQIVARKETELWRNSMREMFKERAERPEDIYILALPFLPRTLNCLYNDLYTKIEMTIGEFVDNYTMTKLSTRIPNLGKRSLNDIIEVLEDYCPGITSRIKE